MGAIFRRPLALFSRLIGRRTDTGNTGLPPITAGELHEIYGTVLARYYEQRKKLEKGKLSKQEREHLDRAKRCKKIIDKYIFEFTLPSPTHEASRRAFERHGKRVFNELVKMERLLRW